MKMQKVLREENEKIVQLKGMTPDNKLPRDLLQRIQSGKNGHPNSPQDKFVLARQADKKNEKRPMHKGLMHKQRPKGRGQGQYAPGQRPTGAGHKPSTKKILSKQ